MNSLYCGSPPHAGGHLSGVLRSGPGVRFTPTRVGTSQAEVLHHHVLPVHPHTRGDIPPLRGSDFGGRGSPPHAWGHLAVLSEVVLAGRFTPTRVGTSPRP